jgi:hypothetical protein
VSIVNRALIPVGVAAALITLAASSTHAAGGLHTAGPTQPPGPATLSASFTIPIPDGPIRPVTDEHAYVAFPSALRVPETGTALVVYRNGFGHASTNSQLRLRRQTPGGWWSEPTIVTPAAWTGWTFGAGGLTAESASAGGRIYATFARSKSTGPTTANDYTSWVVWSDNDGLSWSAPSQLPNATAGYTIASGVLWIPEGGPHGTVLASIYHRPAGAADTVVRIYASTDRGASWTTRGNLAIPRRPADEPQLVRRSDGHLTILIRSDGKQIPGSNPARYYYSYIYTAISTNLGAAWSTPAPQIYHASGSPNASVLSDGRIVVIHRGSSEPTGRPHIHNPTRIAMLNPDGVRYMRDGTELLHQQMDVGDLRRSMYGAYLPGWGTDPASVIWSAENSPQSNPNGTAVLYQQAFTWR